VAGRYDADFTDTPLGRRQRHIVHRYLEGLVREGTTVLELNCGTGEDALWLARRGARVVATDASGEMVEMAQRKGMGAGMEGRIEYRTMAIEELGRPDAAESLGRFDLILSNFDGLNCIADLSPLPEMLARHLLPGGSAILVFMNPVCAMEILYLLARGRARRTLQRLRRDGLPVHIGNDIAVRTFFHPVGDVKKMFSERFIVRHIEAVGLITPPTLMRDFYHRHEKLFRPIFPVEDLLSPIPPFNRMGDHVLIHFQSRS
jgi:2-polyprenyl-3-methyl-5-hydroxy-6-metoxy-1,4-benzoquinol methylase